MKQISDGFKEGPEVKEFLKGKSFNPDYGFSPIFHSNVPRVFSQLSGASEGKIALAGAVAAREEQIIALTQLARQLGALAHKLVPKKAISAQE